MYILQATGNATGDWYRVLSGGDFIVANRSGDSLGGGTLVIEFADANESTLAMTSAASFSAPIQSQVVTIARGTLVRAKLTASTAPACNVLLQHTEIQSPALVVVE